MKKKLLPKKSLDIHGLRKLAGQCSKLKFTPKVRCDECKFIELSDDKLRFIRDKNGRVVCEICFERLNISEWEFVKR